MKAALWCFVFLFMVSLCSCMADYTCHCTTSTGDANYQYGKVNNDKATRDCKMQQANNPGDSCFLGAAK